MKLLTSLVVELLAVAYYLDKVNAVCNQDNCYRALFPPNDPSRLATAESFCQTYTQGISTETTGFNPRFTSGCGSNPSRYSSACSCAPTITQSTTTTLVTSTSTTSSSTTSSSTTSSSTTSSSTTSTSTSPIPTSGYTCDYPYEQFKNGDFECGSIYPWRALVTEGTTYGLTSPGYTGSFAFEVDQNAPLDNIGLGEATISQLFYITPGVQYVLTFNTFFNTGAGGFIGVKFNGQPQYTVDAEDKLGPGVWNSNTISFTAAGGQYLLEFEFLFGSSSVVAKLDNIVLTPDT